MNKWQEAAAIITGLDQQVMTATQERLDNLTKPQGSLGRMEDLARQVAGITGQVQPGLPAKASILLAADHGVVAEGVSAYPQEVTAQMVLNFANGGAAMSVLARHAGAQLELVDIGVAADLPEVPGLWRRKVAYGTANITGGPAMTREQAQQALDVGVEVAEHCIGQGIRLFGIGEMGIGNTTASTAILAVWSGLAVREVVGRGTGVDDQRLERKIQVIEQALELNNPDPGDPLDVLAKVGGLEIAGLAGVIIAAAARRVPVILDGFISGAAALVATRLAPSARDYLIASHLSEEPGHQVMLAMLGLQAMLRLNMRLGEGTGAALAMGLVDASLKILAGMSTFSQAGVSGQDQG